MIVSYDDFAKLDIRIGTILAAERIEDTDKLVKLSVNLGAETRQIVAGIAQIVADLAELIGKQIPVLTNLEPRTIRGVESQGMILAADENGAPVLLHPDHTLPAGSDVR